MESQIKVYSVKVGLSGDTKVLERAEDHLRSLRSEGQRVAPLKLGDSCKIVMCIHLAADFFKAKVDESEYIKLAGVAKKVYRNGLSNLKSILGIEDVISVEEVTVQLGCPQIRQKALKVFDTYKQSLIASLGASRQGHINLAKSIFPCAAVATALKVEKIKFDSKKLLAMGQVGRKELDEMVRVMTEAWKKASEDGVRAAETSQTSKRSLTETVEAMVNENMDPHHKSGPKMSCRRKSMRINEEETDDFDQEEYYLWKERILKQAGLWD